MVPASFPLNWPRLEGVSDGRAVPITGPDTPRAVYRGDPYFPVALEAIEALRDDITDRSAVFAFARVKQDLLARLEAFGLASKIGTELLFPTLPTAVQAYQDRTKDPQAGNQGP